MLRKELKEENWIDFVEGADLDEEIPGIEIARMVFDASKHCGMYGKKSNKYLERRMKELSTFKRELEDISNISIVRNAKMFYGHDFVDTYLIIEDKYGPNVVLELKNGSDMSYVFNQLYLTKDSEIEELYSSDENTEVIQLSEITEVVYYPKATLINEYTKVESVKGHILEITDTLNDKLYVDCINNKVFYNRNNYSLINKGKTIELFKTDKELVIPNRVL